MTVIWSIYKLGLNRTLTALRTAPVHLQSLFPDQLLIKAEEVSRSEERRSSGNSHRKPVHYHPGASSITKPSHQPNRKSVVPAWKQIRDWQRGNKGRDKASIFQQNRLRVPSSINDHYSVKFVTGLKDFVVVSVSLESLNPPLVFA